MLKPYTVSVARDFFPLKYFYQKNPNLLSLLTVVVLLRTAVLPAASVQGEF